AAPDDSGMSRTPEGTYGSLGRSDAGLRRSLGFFALRLQIVNDELPLLRILNARKRCHGRVGGQGFRIGDELVEGLLVPCDLGGKAARVVGAVLGLTGLGAEDVVQRGAEA